MKKLFVVLITSLLFIVTSCAMMKKTTSKNNASITQTTWQLISIKDFEMENEKPATLSFTDSNKRFGGNGGCNGFGGSYVLSGNNSIQFSQVVSTKMYCNNGSKTEDKYFSALANVNHYNINDGRLMLMSGGDVLLEFKPYEAEK